MYLSSAFWRGPPDDDKQNWEGGRREERRNLDERASRRAGGTDRLRVKRSSVKVEGEDEEFIKVGHEMCPTHMWPPGSVCLLSAKLCSFH